MFQRICIFGAGAVGLDLAYHCVKAGMQVTLIARGRTAEVLAKDGITHLNNQPRVLPADTFSVFSAPEEAGSHDIVFLTVKVHALLEIASNIPLLLHSESLVVSATNGIPPWYSYLQSSTIGRFSFPLEPRTQFLESIPPERLLGCVVERSCELSGPGVLLKSAGKGFTIGEITHKQTSRCKEIEELLSTAGYRVTCSDDIHRDIWLKLVGNIAVSPMSVITGQTIGEMLAHQSCRARMREAALEAVRVGERIGVLRTGDCDVDALLVRYEENLRDHRPSMLKDFQCGKSLEIGRMLEVVEILGTASGPLAPVETGVISSLREELLEKLASHRSSPNIDSSRDC